MKKFKKMLILAIGVLFVVCLCGSVFVACNSVGTYKVTIAEYKAEEGTVEIVSGKDTFKAGDDVTVKVTPKDGFELKSFSLGQLDMTEKMLENNNEFTFKINRDRTVKADFQEYGLREKMNSVCKVNIDNSKPERGTVTINSDRTAFAKNTELTFTANAKDGFELRKFIINGVDFYDDAIRNNGSVTYKLTETTTTVEVGFQIVEDYTKIEYVDEDEFYDKIDRRGRVLVDFWATWCGPCKKLAPHIQTLANTQATNLGLKILEVDIDNNLELFKRYSVNAPQYGDGEGSIPFLMLFENGEPLKGSLGYIDYVKLLNFVSQE